MNHRTFLFLRIAPVLILVFSIFQPQSSAHAAVTLTITPNTWNVIGLDSNNPATGPYRFPVGAKVCSSVDTTNVVVNFVWDDGTNASDIYLRSGSLSSITIPSITAGATNCKDAYFEVEVDRAASSYNKTRRYHVTATDDSGTVATIQPRELFVEHLISQNRNAVTDVKYGTTLSSLTSVPAGGAMSLMVGSTYYIQLYGGTATQGYNQFEDFINFPNTIFQILSVSTTYSADSNIAHVPNPNLGLYGDACTWDNDPNSPTYRSCIGGDDKAGGSNVVTAYQVKIISGGGTTQTLNTLLYDFSGSSYHYNADFSAGSRIAYIIDPSAVIISKSFNPKAIAPGSTSAMTIKLTNPTAEALTGITFTDTFPSGMTLANTTNNNTCNGSLTNNSDGTLNAGDLGIRLSGGTLAGNSVCTITVNVTAPAGTYPNTTGPLYINTTTNTGNTASDTLTASSTPACLPGQTLVRWTMPAGASAPPDTSGGAPTTNNTGFTATAYHFPVASQAVASGSGSPNTTSDDVSWETWGYKNDSGYVEFAVDTRYYSNVQMAFMVYTDSSTGPTTLAVTYSTSSGSGNLATYTGATLTPGVWNTKSIDLSSVASTTGATTIRIIGSGANNDNSGADAYFNDVYFTGCSIPAPAPTISKSFLLSPVIKGGTSTLRFTLNNTVVGNRALSGVAFTDVLPAGLSIADSSTSQCGGTLTTTAATSTIALTGGTLAAGGSCTFNVTVTGATEGQYDNVTGYVSSTQSGTSTNYATASLTVIAPPVLAKSFSPTSIFTGSTSTLRFTITNPNLYNSLSGLGFTDTLPTGLTVTNGTTNSLCGSGSLVITGANLLTFSGGSLAANASCFFDVTVTGTAAGPKDNITTAITSIEGGNGNNASASLVVNDQTAFLDLTKQVSTSGTDPWSTFIGVAAGGNVYYRFKVYNSGDLPFTAISVTDPTLASTSADPATCNWAASLPLVPGATAYCIKGPISASATAGSYPNTATAHGTYASGTKDSSTSTATYATPGLTITKNAAESYFIVAGDILHYSFIVTNSGFVPLLGPVTVADDKAMNESCPAVATVGDLDTYLDPGESVTCTATYTVGPGDVSAGSVTNTASALAGGINSNTASKTVNIGPDLTVTKVNNTSSVAAIGTSFTWTVAVTNNGRSDAIFEDGQTILSDPLPATANYGLILMGGGTFAQLDCGINSGTLICTAKGGRVTLPPGGSFSVTFDAAPTSSDNLTNTATVDPNNNVVETNEANNTGSDALSVLVPPSISKSFGSPSIALNETTTLSFTISNPNNATALTGVAFTDVLPAGLTVTDASSAQCGGTLTSIAPDTISLSEASIAPNGTCNLSLTVTGTAAGLKNNITGTVTSTNGGTGNTASASITVVAPPAITKSFAASTVALNGTTTLTFTITNPAANTVALSGVGFTDTYPSGLQNAATPNAVTTCTGGTVTAAAHGPSVTLSGATVAVNSSCTVTVTVTGTSVGTKTNSVTVSSTNGGTSNTATANLSVVSAVKTIVSTSESSTGFVSGFERVAIGEVIHYRLTTDLPEGVWTNVQITDVIDSGLLFLNDGTASVSFICDGSCSHSAFTITPAVFSSGTDPTFDLGTVTNRESDANAEYLIVEFNALILNLTSNNSTGATRNNSYIISFNGATITSSNVGVRVAEPSITNLTKSVTPATGPYYPGDTVTYTLTYSNGATGVGRATAFDVFVTDPLSANLDMQSVSVVAPSGSTVTDTSTLGVGGVVRVLVNQLPPAVDISSGPTGVTITVTARIVNSAPGGMLSNTANLTYTGLPGGVTTGDTNGACPNSTGSCTPGTSGALTGERNGTVGSPNTYTGTSTTNITVTPSADLSVTKTDGITSIGASGATAYTIVVTNHGPSDVDNAVFTDPVTTGLNVTNVTCGNSTGGAICPTAGNTTVALMQGAGILIPSLPSGGSVTFTVNGTVTATTGSIANTANVAPPSGVTDPGTFSNSATDTDNIVEIIAVDDMGSAVNGTSGGQSLGNVLTNDTLNGSPATLATVTLTQVSTTNPGITLNTATGAVDVAADTAAGNYIVTYQICDQANLTICDTATVSVPVVVIDAVNDTGFTVNGATGGQSFANVLTNDTLNGNPATLANINLTQVSTTNPGVTLDVATGAVNVTPGTPSGNYTLTYQICDQTYPSICDTATVTVPVSAAPIVATDDSASGVNGVTGAAAVLNVLDNDTLNGLSVAPIDVMLTETAPDPSGALTLKPDGTIDVAPGTPSGTYQLTYQICEVLNPTNCATAVARVTVATPAAPVAQDDSATTSFNTPVTLSNITANDTAFGPGNSIVINTIDLDPSTSNQRTSFTDLSGNQWSVNTTTGQVTFTPAPNFTGTATIPYSVQDASGQTATANLLVTVGPPASLSGKVFDDADLNGTQAASETGIGAVKVDLYDSAGTTLIATTSTAVDGSYSFTNLTPGDYLVLETDPAGFVSTTSNSVGTTVKAGSSATVNFGDYALSNATLSSIAGTVFDDANANGMQDVGETVLSGVTVVLENNAGTVVATITTNASGGYGFSNLAAGLYTVIEADPTGYMSTTLNNVAVNLSAGALAMVNFGDQTSAAAQIADPAVTKFGSPSSATVGSAVVYTITVGNNGNANASNVVLTDTKPSFLDIVSISISPNPGLSPVIAGNTFTIDFGTITPSDSYNITVLTRVNPLGQPPGGANNASLTTSSLTDRASNNAFSAALLIPSNASTEKISKVRRLPDTGFAPGVISDLSDTPQEAYVATNDVTLEIPALGIKIPIVGVPLKNGTWNVAWLGNQSGWLEGSAFPSWKGNSLLTGHVYLSNGLPGPFVNLSALRYGDQILVHAYGQKYAFEVQTNTIVEPSDTSAFKHEEQPWLTLLTCKEYDEKTNSYRKRMVIRAVLVSVARE